MTEPDFDNDDLNPDDDQDGQPQQGGRNWKALREKANKYDTEVGPLRRENAFLKAGIPDTPQGRLLTKAYDGELTAEAIRKAAVEYGVLDDSDQEIPADERAAIERADAASSGGSFTPPKSPDMNQALRAATGRGRL